MEKLGEDGIAARLERLDGWVREGDEIRKRYRFANFGESLDFVDRVGELAEEVDHHPDIDIRYDTVDLALSTHFVGGLTGRDFDLAERIDRLR